MEELAKLDAEIEARAKIESERKAALDVEAAERAMRKKTEELRERLMQEAKLQAEQAVKNAEKAPIRFKDAVGRKFSFPFHLCQTWTVSRSFNSTTRKMIRHADLLGRVWKSL